MHLQLAGKAVGEAEAGAGRRCSRRGWSYCQVVSSEVGAVAVVYRRAALG